MLSLLRGVSQQRALSWQQLRQASFAVRDLFRDGSDETGTLLNRFARHIGIENHRIAPLVATSVRYADFFPVTDMRYFDRELSRTPADQLPALLLFAFTYRPSADPAKYVQVLNLLDEAALRQLPEMDEDTVLRTLYSWLFLMPNWLARTDFYHAALQRLSDGLAPDSVKEKFVQVCFYLGLNKKHTRGTSSQQLQRLLAAHLEHHLDELSTMDLAVVANAAYKTGTEMHSAAFEAQLEAHILRLPLDEEHIALLITLLKSMRQQRVRSPSVCERVTTWCATGDALKPLQSRALPHLLAFLAENLWDDAAATGALVQSFLHRLRRLPIAERSSYAESLRAKDVATFLYASAQLNCVLSPADLQELEACLLGKVHNGEFAYFPDQLVDACLSLWMLGFRSRDLLQAAIEAKADTRPNPKQPKVENRLTVLLAAAAIEEPGWQLAKAPAALQLGGKVPPYMLRQQPGLPELASRLSQLSGVAAVTVSCPISGINIPGLHIRFAGAEPEVFADILSESQTLHFSGAPIALLRLKTALLSASGHRSVVVKLDDLNTANDSNLHALLLDAEEQQRAAAVHSI